MWMLDGFESTGLPKATRLSRSFGVSMREVMWMAFL